MKRVRQKTMTNVKSVSEGQYKLHNSTKTVRRLCEKLYAILDKIDKFIEKITFQDGHMS